MSFEVDDVVRIERLLVPERQVDGSVPTPAQPRVGETGTVIESVGEDIYLVEHATADGVTIWLTEFMEAELALVHRPVG